jgi:dihydrodipicolinate synthase/N-acetylneuraminate lyase
MTSHLDEPGGPAAFAAKAALVRGVCPVIAVPFGNREDLDVGSFRRLVRHVVGTGVSSVMFPGFASEFHKLSAEERSELVGILVEEAQRRNVATVISVHQHATALAVASAAEATEAGADVLNILPSNFLRPSPAQVQSHIRAVLESVPDTPVVLQYAPAETGTSLDAGAIASIASRLPNLCLVKVEASPAGPFITALAEATPAIPALIGYAGVQLPDALRRGARGVQPGCSFTEIYIEIWQRWADGSHAAAEELHRALLPYLSYWMQSVELVIAAEKLISAERGLIETPVCRQPGYQLDRHEVADVRRFLEQFASHLAAAG